MVDYWVGRGCCASRSGDRNTQVEFVDSGHIEQEELHYDCHPCYYADRAPDDNDSFGSANGSDGNSEDSDSLSDSALSAGTERSMGSVPSESLLALPLSRAPCTATSHVQRGLYTSGGFNFVSNSWAHDDGSPAACAMLTAPLVSTRTSVHGDCSPHVSGVASALRVNHNMSVASEVAVVWSPCNADSFPQIGPSLRPMVPRRLVTWFGMVLCGLCLLVTAVYMKRVYRTNGYTHTLTLGIAFLLCLVSNLTLRVAGLLRNVWLLEHEELLVLWSCLFAGLMASLVCVKDPSQEMCEGIRASDALPNTWVVALLSGLWSLVSQLPRWCIFKQFPRTRPHILVMVALGATTLQAVWASYMLLSTPCGLHFGKSTIWFGMGNLFAAQVLFGQLICFMPAGVGTGFRVIICPLTMGLVCLSSSVVENDDRWGVHCWVCWALYLCAVSCGAIATHEPEEICSTSPLYERDRRGRSGGTGIFSVLRSFKGYSRTWRGTMAMCALNSIISAWVYRPWVERTYTDYWQNVPQDVGRRSFEPLRIGSADRSCKIILTLATLSFCISMVSILSDRCKQRDTWHGSAFPHLPMDRHFRLITALKVGMIVVKTDFLMTYADPKDDGGSTITQVVSIALTTVCANWSVISMLRAALDISHSFAGMFRYPVTLWRSSITCLLLWHSLNGVMLLTAVLDVVRVETFLGMDIPAPQELSWLGVMLPLGSFWLYMGNELALVLSSKLSHPQVFAAVQSRQGIQIVATVTAVGTPMAMICKTAMWLYYCANRKIGLDEPGVHWQAWLCLAVSMIFIVGGVVAYASIG